jgi:fibronectin-binding autotransporter adhesin
MTANTLPKFSAGYRASGRTTNQLKTPTSRKRRSALYAGLSTAVMAAAWGLTPTASAANLTWDASGTNPTASTDGSGTWDATSFANWSNGATDNVWVNANLDTAVIGANNGAAGIITLSPGAGITVGGLIFNAATTGNYAITGDTLTLGGASTVQLVNTSAAISSTIAGTTGLSLSGTGTFTVSGTNTYTGTTAITGATFDLAPAGTLASTVITVNSGAFTAESGSTLAVGTALTDNGTVNFNSPTVAISTLNGGGTLNLNSTALTISAGGTFSGAINGTGNLTATGGVLTLSGASGYSGPTSINGGTIQISGVNGIGNASATNTIALNAGTLESTGNTYDLTTTRTITLNGPGTIQSDAGTLTVSGAITNGSNLLTVTGAGGVTIAGAIGSGSGAVTKTGTGTLALTNSNSYSGGTNINGGTVSFSALNNLGSGPISFANGGTLLYTSGTSDISLRTVTIGTGGGTINTNNNLTPVTYAGSIGNSGAGGLTVLAGTGKLILNGSNTYAGGTTLNSGTLVAGNSQALGSTSGTFTFNNGNGLSLDVAVNSPGIAAYNVLLPPNDNGTIVSDRATSGPGITQAFGALTVGNSGLTTTAGANVSGGSPAVSFTSTTINATTPTFTANTATMSLGAVGLSTVTSASIILAGTDTVASTVGPLSIGAGVVTKNGAGTWALNTSSNYTGGTSITGGTLIAGNTQALGALNSPLSVTTGGILDIQTDTFNAYNTTVGTATIEPDRATASSPGITQTLGTLSIGGTTLTVAAGPNVSGGSPALAFGAVTATGAPTFAPTTAALSLGTITGTNVGVTFGGTSTGANSVGSVNIGTGAITKNTAATWSFNGSSSLTGGTAITSSGTTILGADNAFGTVGLLNLNTGTGFLQSNGSHAIGDPAETTASNFELNGTGAISFNNTFTNNINGSGNLLLDGSAMTTFHGGYVLSSGTGGRTLTLLGTGNLTIDSTIQPNSAASAAEGIIFNGTGTLTLASPGSVGGVGAGGGGATISIASGAAPVITGVSQTGNSTLLIKGNYTIGTSGSASVTIKGGNGTTTTQGILSLVDGQVNTLTINSNVSAATVLTMAGTAGNSSILNMEVGQGSADEIVLGSAVKASIGAGGVTLNLTGIGGLTGGTQTLISAPDGGLTGGGTFTCSLPTNYLSSGNTSGNFNGYQITGLTVTNTAVTITENSGTATPAIAYWKGGTSVNWNTITGGNANTTNWTSDSGGTTDTHQIPGSTTDVVFSAASPANSATTLGQNFSINSLQYNSNAAAGSISGSTLTIGAGGTANNTAGNGITDAASNVETINSNVTLGASQTWTNSSPSALTVNGNITGSGLALTTAGTGTIALGGTNSFTGGLAINAGVVQLTNASALSSSIPVNFGASAAAGTKLQINSQNVTIGALSTNATPGSPVIENGGGSNATLTVNQSTSTTYAGVLQNGGGVGTLGLTKTGVGTLTLGGVNTYSGATTVNGGSLLVNGSLGMSSNVTVTGTTDNATVALGGTGTINGAVSISAPTGSGRINAITGAGIGTMGTLTLTDGLTFAPGTVGYFDINNGGTFDNIDITGGSLTAPSGTLIRVPSGLTTADTYNLITFNGAAPSLGNFTLQTLAGNSVASNYSLILSGNNLELKITNNNAASPTISLNALSNTRVMMSTTVSLSGNIGNTGQSALSGTLADNGGTLTVGSFSPPSPISVPASGSVGYTASFSTGTNLGTQTYSVKVTDPAADPTSANAGGTVNVLDNRVVTPTASTAFGTLHVGSSVSVPVSLTSTGADGSYTRVTVANAGPDANGISVSGGSPSTVFNGSTSDSRTLAGTFTTAGNISGPIVLTTTGEGLAGESPINVSIPYSAQIFSGKAGWITNGSGSWGTNSNWGDTAAGDLGGAGAPGLSGALSIGDTALFGSATSGSPITVTLDGVSPSLAGMAFNATGPIYTIATGSGGTIALQNVATPIDVANGVTATISAVMQGTALGINKTSAGTLVLAGTNTYTGPTQISNGILAIGTGAVAGGAGALPGTSALILGDGGTNSGELILGNNGVAYSVTVAGLTTSGAGTANIVDSNGTPASDGLSFANYPTLNLNFTGTQTFSGTLGDNANGTLSNYFNLKMSGGTEILTGSNNLAGYVLLAGGTLGMGSANAISNTFGVRFQGGILQFSAANTTDISSATTTNPSNPGAPIYDPTIQEKFDFDTNGQTVTFNGVLADTAAPPTLTKVGAGTLILGNSSVFTSTGNASAVGGVLQALNQLPNSSVITVGGEGTGAGQYGILQTTGTFTRTIGTAAGDLTWASNGGFAAKTGPLILNLSGGAMQYWGTNSFLGSGSAAMAFGSTTADGLVQFPNNFDLCSQTSTLSANFQRTIAVDGIQAAPDGSNTYGFSGNRALLSGVISANVPLVGTAPNYTVGAEGNDGFTKTGNGVLILSGLNTYSGPTVINGGTLVAGNNAPVGTAGAFGDGHTSGTQAGTQKVTLGGGNQNGTDGTSQTNSSPSLYIGGPYTVAIPVVVTNIATTGTYTIGGSTDNVSTFSGSITISEPLTIAQVATTGSDALNITGGISAAANSTLTFSNIGAVNVSTSPIGGGAGKIALVDNGSGTVTLSAADTYSGGTTVNVGTLTGTGTSPLGATTGTLAVNNPNVGAGTAVTLNLSTTSATTTGSLSGTIATPSSGTNTATINNGGQLLTVNQTTPGAFAGSITGGGGLTLGSLSTSTLTLSGSNGYSGNTTIMAGTLAITGGGSIASSPRINLNGGSLNVTGVSSPPFVVGASQTLMGQGTVVGAVNIAGTIQTGQTNNIGGKTAATLTLGTGSTLGGSTLMDLTAASTSDEITVGGGLLNLGGSLTVTNPNGITFAAGQSYQLFGFGSDTGSFTNAFPAGLPTLGGSLFWNTSTLTTNGIISIGSTSASGSWGSNVNGDWETATNWIGNTIAQGASTTATFADASVTSGPITVTLRTQPETVGALAFNGNGGPYVIASAGGNVLTLNNGASAATIGVTSGNQTISAPVSLTNGVTVTTAGSTSLAVSGNVSGTGPLTAAGGGSTTLSGSNSYTGGTNVTGGKLNIQSTTALPTASALSVSSGASVVVNRNGGSEITLNLASLSNAGLIDLQDNLMVISGANANSSTYTAINNMLQSGFTASQNWSGTIGITTSTLGGNSLYTLGEALNGSTLTVGYAYYGDADMSGHVDGTDYSLIDTGFGSAGALTGWQNGDFNYDGHIDGSDYSLIDNAFNTQLATAPAAQVAVNTSEIAGGSAAVPEPASLGLLGLGAIGLMSRRRRRA